MNWEAAGAIGEIVGAVAVVVSISYLAIQIRSQTREARLTATRELARDYRHVIETITGDEQLFAVYQKAMENFDALSAEERVRIHMRLFSPLFERKILNRKISCPADKCAAAEDKTFSSTK